MRVFCTEFKGVDITDGKIKRWSGNRIEADTWEEAEEFCRKNYPYLKVTGEFVEEIDFDFKNWINLN
jgi:hypothetical protein